ncbi:MAG: cofactor-independent phosphoglycerate mutase [Lachnospiraceae bacterium]
MKYIVVLGDGMADRPIKELGNKTPLMAADTPMMDELAGKSEIGLAHTIPEGMSPGSDTANLAVLGYDPKKYYTGRSPLEALSIGVDMKETDIAMRCNIVTLSEEEPDYANKKILDHSSGEISTEEAAGLLKCVKDAFQSEVYQFYVGTSYRHLTIWDKGSVVPLTPPHDILGKQIGEYLPKEEALRHMMEKSYELLNNHPINEERARKGLNKANSIWFWGAGTKPCLTSFEEKTGKRGVMISAVDLLKGIAIGAGMKVIRVDGADGTLHTNYEGKAMAAVDALLKDGYDFAYIHVEAPDEMGHQGSIERKIQAIEYLDSRVIRIVKEQMDASGEPYRMLVTPDHPTPIEIRTHSSEPVPYLLYDSERELKKLGFYNEAEAAISGNVMEEGWRLIEKLFAR